MKLFVSDIKSFEQYQTDKDFCWTKDQEIVFYGAYRYDHHISLTGINTTKATTIFKVVDLNIDKEFIYEILIDTYKKLGHKFIYPTNIPKIEAFGIELDILKNFDLAQNEAEKFDVGDICKVKGWNIYKIN